jgi:disulfide bond formation protein DsbB
MTFLITLKANKMIKKLLLTIAAALTVGFTVHPTWAAVQLDDSFRPENLPTFEMQEAVDPNHPETAATQSLIYYIGNFISQALLFTGALAVIFLIIAGLNYIFAFGKDERIERGKLGVMWSLIGLLMILLSYAIVQGILQLVVQVDESVT